MNVLIETLMWSQLSQYSQLSQSTTNVATPTTIVAKDHNCRNSNHNCHNLDQPQSSQHQSLMSQFFRKKIIAFLISILNKFLTFHPLSTILASLLTTKLWNLWNTVTQHKTIRYCHNCHNFDIKIVTVVKYWRSTKCHKKDLGHFRLRHFFKYAVDELIYGQWNCWQKSHQ